MSYWATPARPARSVLPAVVGPLLYSRPEPVEDQPKPMDRESSEIRISDARKIRCRDSRAAVRRSHAKALLIERLDDFGRQDRLQLLGICVFVPKVTENIPLARTTSNPRLSCPQFLIPF